MLAVDVSAAKRPARPRSKKPTPKPARGEGLSLAEIGRRAADDAQRKALWAALEASDFSPSAAADALKVPGGSTNVLRALKRLGLLDEYDAERARRGLKPGPRPQD